jgi:hypothetical protein
LTLVNPSPTGVVTGTLKRDLVAANRGDELFGERRSVFLERDNPGVVRLPRHCDACRFNDGNDGGCHFRSDAVARN